MTHAKIDANHGIIVNALREMGCSVQSLAEVKGGCPDLLVGVNGKNVLIEVKDGTKSPSDRLLTSYQKNWHANWRGTVHIVETVSQALDVVAFYRDRIRRAER